MANVKNVFGLFVGMALSAVSAHAQPPTPTTEKFFASVNIGGQLATRTINIATSKIIYAETATLKSGQKVTRGPVVDFGGGYRVWGDVFAGIVVSRFSNTETAETETSVPDPIFFNRPKTVTGTTTDLKRTEVAVAPHAVWAMALTDKLDLGLSAGFAVIHVSQDLVGSFSVAAGTQNVTTTTTTEKGTAVGPYVAVDFIYNVTPIRGFKPLYGFGGYVRYAGGKVDLPSVPAANVGGMEAGGGIRLRF
jgi:hypothetical protein